MAVVFALDERLKGLDKMTANPEFKVNRQTLYKRVMERMNFDDESQTVQMVGDAMFDEIENIVLSGGKVSLKGFGSFFYAVHKGHPVQFGKKDVSRTVPSYRVFKFQPSNVLNKKLRVL